jgi:hypothetical protein
MNLQSIIDQSKMRDNAVAELCRAIDELDQAALQRVLAHVADRLQGGVIHARETSPLGRSILEAERRTEDFNHKAHVAKTIARAERGVRTRKANAAKKKAEAGASIRGRAVIDALKSNPKAGISVKAICNGTGLSVSNVYAQLKKLGAYSNGEGLWWTDKKTYLARFPIAGRGKKAAKNKLANGAAEKTP